MMLNARKVEAAKGKEKSYKLSDGGGLLTFHVEPRCLALLAYEVPFCW